MIAQLRHHDARRFFRSWRPTELSRSLHYNSEVYPVSTLQSSAYAQTKTSSSVINFGIGQPSPSLLPLDMFRDAAMARFTPTQDPVMLQYGFTKGFIGFREEIAKFVAGATSTKSVDPETLMVTAGNSQAISHAAVAFSKTNRRVFVEEPTYFLVHQIFRELCLDLKEVRTGKDGIDLDALEAKLASGDVPAFLYTIPFFHNPTGAVMSADRCKRLVALAQKYGFHVISDEPYNLLHLNGGGLPSLSSYDDDSGLVVSLGSFSKILAPGLRLGWAHSSKETIEKLSTIGALRSGGGQNPITAALVHTVLEQDLLLRHIDHLKGIFQARKTAMCTSLRKHCPDVAFTEPSGGYFVWLQLPDGVNADLLLKVAETRHGVAFTPGTRCSLGNLNGTNGGTITSAAMTQCARLSFAFYSEDEIRVGIQRLQSAIVCQT